MKLEIEVDVRDGTIDKKQLEEHLRKEAILTLFGAQNSCWSCHPGAWANAPPVYGVASTEGNPNSRLHPYRLRTGSEHDRGVVARDREERARVGRRAYRIVHGSSIFRRLRISLCFARSLAGLLFPKLSIGR